MAQVDAKRPQGVAVVTGAASGMGEAAAKILAESGWTLLACDLNGERLAATVAGFAAGTPVETLAGDISDAGYPERLVAALAGRPIAALIHCAGLSPTMADPARILEVNLAATFRLVDVVRPRMSPGAAAVLFASSAAHMIGTNLDEQISRVVAPDQVASLSVISPDPGMAYTVSKRAVFLLAQREAAAFGKHGARIATISPGIIDTPMGRAEMEKQPIMKKAVDGSALGRAARAEEVAAVAAFLCTPAASFVTGVDILVDGGSIAAMRAAAPG